MKLKKLTIEFQDWGEHKGGYIGEVSYDDPAGKISLHLSPDVSAEYLRLSAVALNQFSLDGLRDLNAALASATEPKAT